MIYKVYCAKEFGKGGWEHAKEFTKFKDAEQYQQEMYKKYGYVTIQFERR